MLSQFDVDRFPINETITCLQHFDYGGPLLCPILSDDGSLCCVVN